MSIHKEVKRAMSRKQHPTVRNAISLLGIAIGVTLLTGCSGGGTSDSTSTIATYLLSTNFQGDNMVLSAEDVGTGDTQPPAVLLLALADNSGRQNWLFKKLDNGAFNISNEFIGDAYSVDVVNDGVADKIKLASTAGVSGQSWMLTPLDNGYCRLTNNFTGSEIALDIRPEGDQNEPRLSAAGDFSGQQWRITSVGNSELANEPAINACSGGTA